MPTLVYNLSSIPEFNNLLEQNDSDAEESKYFSVHSYSTKADEKYSIVRYNKELLFSELVPTYGLLRSVILSEIDNSVLSFAPPKSVSPDIFMQKYPSKQDSIIAEEFVEGTMINLFYDYDYGINGCWQIATRNTVGAEVSFYRSKKTFRTMFMDAAFTNNFHFKTLNPLFCYSFVLQHPDNRIVVPFKQPQLYLVAVYQIINGSTSARVVEQDLNEVRDGGMWHLTSIKFPQQYEFNTYTELIEKFASANTPYDIMGVVIKHKETGERTKFRNPIYEEVRHLRGNQPKLQYQYLCLRHSGKLSQFLKYFPETKEEMSQFRDQVHMFTNTLHQNYISCYVKKEKPLREFPQQYRTHMFKLHETYLNDLREKRLFVTSTVVIKYVNQLAPSLLMYCLNHNLRKRMVDTIMADSSLE
jgi:hypothetical protein